MALRVAALPARWYAWRKNLEPSGWNDRHCHSAGTSATETGDTITGSASRVGLTTSTTGTGLIVRLSGEIDRSNAEATSAGLMRAAGALPPPDLIVLDLTTTALISAAAVHVLDAFNTACADRGVRIHLVLDPGSVVYRVVSLTGLTRRLPVFGTLDQAV
jgi:anti-anti-sigma factor